MSYAWLFSELWDLVQITCFLGLLFRLQNWLKLEDLSILHSLLLLVGLGKTPDAISITAIQLPTLSEVLAEVILILRTQKKYIRREICKYNLEAYELNTDKLNSLFLELKMMTDPLEVDYIVYELFKPLFSLFYSLFKLKIYVV